MTIAENIKVPRCTKNVGAFIYVDLADPKKLGRFAFESERACLDYSSETKDYPVLRTRRLKGTKLESNGNIVARYAIWCTAGKDCRFLK